MTLDERARALMEQVFERIAHGDAKHREWLRETLAICAQYEITQALRTERQEVEELVAERDRLQADLQAMKDYYQYCS